MATAGPAFPSAATTASETPWLDNDWTTPGNVTADDGSTANVTAATYDAPDQTFVLKATGFDFSAIPDGSTINGVTCRVNAWYAAGTGSLDLCQLLDVSAAKVGTNQCLVPVALTTTNTTVITKGSASDLWGNALTAAWVKDPDFGVALGILATAANADVFIDYVTLEIDYTAPPPTGTLATTLAGATLSASGSETISGTLASTLAGATLAASGSVEGGPTGTLATTLTGATLAATGSETITGTLTASLTGATMTAAGGEAIGGTFSTLLTGATLTASGTASGPAVTGTLTTTLANATSSASGEVTIMEETLPTFSPPTIQQSMAGDALFSRYGVPVGQSVVRKGGVFVLDPYPWLGDLNGLVDGTDYFLGGHIYSVTTEIGNELVAAGFTVDGL
jgi:hypothetical protein